VPTDRGWGVFWLREDPGASNLARVYYAHVGFDGGIEIGPLLLQVNIPRIPWRGRYYNVAWNGDHYGLIVAVRATLYYYDLSFEGALSGGRAVGPPLFVSSIYDQEADSDLAAFPGGFAGVIEGDCMGHSCSYAFRLGPHGEPLGSVYNLVDFDYTHQFWPRVAYDGIGFAVISVKDSVSTGGVVTKYIPGTWGSPSARAKVVPSKDYLWDEYPALAWNGERYGAVWTEVNQRPPSGQPPAAWQIHFAAFRRTISASITLADRVLDARANKSPFRWTTQVHPVAGDWAVHYSAWQPQGEPLAVFEYVDGAGSTQARLIPFTLSADALGSSLQRGGPQPGRIGIARGDSRDGVSTVTFFTLDPPRCE